MSQATICLLPQSQQAWQLVDWDGNLVQPLGMGAFSGIGLCAGRQWIHPLTNQLSLLRSVRMVRLSGRFVPLQQEALAIAALFGQPLPSTSHRMQALSRCNNLFVSSRSQSTPWNEADRMILSGLLDAMIQYTTDELIQLTESDVATTTMSEPVNWILQELDFRISSPALGWLGDRGRLQLRKSHVLRTANRLPEAINVLTTIDNPQMDSWLESAQSYWTCSATLEMAYIGGQISGEDLIQGRQSCSLLSNSLRGSQPPRSVPIEGHVKDGFSCMNFPNPTTGVVFLQRNQNHTSSDVCILDPAGKMVFHAFWPEGPEVLQINLQTLESGMYTAVVSSADGFKSVLKLVLRKN